eukprot:scaffold7664_cov43-Prasinocladus_malaysianus.AAC.1
MMWRQQSNLPINVRSAKSSCAAAAAQSINPSLKVDALQNRVSPETEDVFNDAFWQNTDLVVNALDNVNARLYVDSRCVYFCKPLLESGTLGAKCNTQVVIPNETENYGASRDPPEKSAPMCTVHSFPHNIDHCLTWARSEFEGLLEKAPAEANNFLTDPEKYMGSARTAGDGQARDQLEKASIPNVLSPMSCCCVCTTDYVLKRTGIGPAARAPVVAHIENRPSSFEDCVAYARRKFQDYYHDRIAQLIFTFPEDAVTSTGAPFWSAPKRCPKVLNWSASDPAHASFVQSLAILVAETYGVPRPEWAIDAAKVAEYAAT